MLTPYGPARASHVVLTWYIRDFNILQARSGMTSRVATLNERMMRRRHAKPEKNLPALRGSPGRRPAPCETAEVRRSLAFLRERIKQPNVQAFLWIAFGRFARSQPTAGGAAEGGEGSLHLRTETFLLLRGGVAAADETMTKPTDR